VTDYLPLTHNAILARALGIPAVLGVEGLLDALNDLTDGATVIADGLSGNIFIEPDEVTLADYEQRQNVRSAELAQLDVYRTRPTVDKNGKRYKLYANIGGLADAKAAIEATAEGVGLFRTEFLFMDRASLPSEQEQYNVYSQVAELFAGSEVIIRTLDVGGDKDVPYLGLTKEDNPFLGHRAIRYCLDRTDVFKSQLRAILRAGAAYQNVKIMLPLITSVDEVLSAKEIIAECKCELLGKGVSVDENIAVGIMVETPAAVQIVPELAEVSDFFSIGTNDLTQYTLAVDRGNPKVKALYSPLHLAVLRSVEAVIKVAHAAGIECGVCGEAAADPAMIPLLLSYGLDEFSVGVSAVLGTRKRIWE
jgi:phosphotransferase system enzyme I (PtsI)